MYIMITELEPENEVSKENYEDHKQIYKKEFIETSNLVVGIGLLLYIIFKK